MPFGGQRAVDDINDLDKERGRAGGGVEDLDERFVGADCRRLGRSSDCWGVSGRVRFQHFAPGRSVGQAVFQAELGLQEFVDAADDVGDDGLRGVENAALDFQLFVVGRRKCS